LLYQIADKKMNSGSYHSNLTQSFFRLRRYVVLRCCQAVTSYSPQHAEEPLMLLFPQLNTLGTNCISVTLNSAHAMKISVALPSRNYRPLYAALAMLSRVNDHSDLLLPCS
jgi:hypothetical protein